MRTIEAPALLALWERAMSRHALDRSALLCAWARPELPVPAIADLPLGEVNASLLEVRAASFGDRIQAHVDCGHCGARLGLTVAVHDLLRPGAGSASREVAAGGVRCRPPCLRDLAAVARERDPARAVRQLLERCLIGTAGDDAAGLADAALREIEDALEEADPNADLAFDVRCDACGRSGTAQLDAGELLWDDIEARARALFCDVHVLAGAYGWTESEILALSPERRASYVSMVAP
jgi:hypothetical protein